MGRTGTVCSVPGCPNPTPRGRCPEHERQADQARGTARQRGYGGRAWEQSRAAVLRRDRLCAVCGKNRAVVADHWPTSRKDLVAAGISDPDAPHRMRGLCIPCHSRETARDQPGGWNQ